MSYFIFEIRRVTDVTLATSGSDVAPASLSGSERSALNDGIGLNGELSGAGREVDFAQFSSRDLMAPKRAVLRRSAIEEIAN
jgi:hypothetical protein